MKKHIQMNKIPKFNNAVKMIKHLARYEGKDVNGEAIYNNNSLPIIMAKGTIKLHGTNASICYNSIDGLWTQSKNKIIDPINDNAGFSMFVHKKNKIIMELIEDVYNFHNTDCENNTITIFGEWCGKGIQAGVAISKIEKSFFIFGIKITPNDKEKSAYWVESNIFHIEDPDIFHIEEFDTFEIKIDFENLFGAKKQMKKLVEYVEHECPVAKKFEISGIGEGIVFTLYYNHNRLQFKIKGEKHVGHRKVKQMKSENIDQEKINSVVYQITHMRLHQMVEESFDVMNGGIVEIEGMGKYLKAVKEDIIKEDMDIISDAGLTMKNINRTLYNVSRNFLLELLE